MIFTDNNIARMMEVQFVSDLVMNLEEGLQDFSATKLDNYYKRYDEGFPNADTIKDRLGKIYSIILEQKQDVFKGSIFCIPQVLFSLMLVLDRMKHANRRKLEYCITDIDSRVHAVRTGDNQKAIAADVYEAFSSGNMHRIRFRSKRDSVIEEYLS